MELFGQDMLENQSFMDQADEEFTYTSHLSKLDMFKMEDLVSPYNSRHMNSGIMSAKSLRDIKPIAEKSKIGKFNSFDLNYDKKQTREVTKRKQKLNNNFRLEILERQIDLEEAAKPIFNTVNGYLTTRPISSKTRAILEKAPLHPNSKALKIHDRFASKTVKSRIISQRSKDSTNYDSSGLSLTSSRLQNLEKQKFLISLYSKEDQRIIENAKSEKKTKVKSRLKIKKKSEKKD